MAFDFKKEYKEFYMPKSSPQIVTVPRANYIAVRGDGDPNEEGGRYKTAVGILYAVAYTIKMSKMGDHRIDGYYDFVVPPLEGFWWQDGIDGVDYTDKSRFRWISVIRLPDFVTKEEFDYAVAQATKKKKTDCSPAEFLTIDEGLCVQIMHIGAFDNEPASVSLMDDFLENNGYENDFETGLYYVSSRYYDPETCRFINADSIIDNRGVNTLNLFAYCGNNPVNNQDPDGHFFFGALVGGIIGGAAGAITALVKGKSVTAGLLTGAATGAAIGLVCDIVATGGMSAVVGVALCGVAAGVGNAVNQYANYKIEKKAQTQNKKTNKTSQTNNSSGKKTPTSSNGKLASECNSFADYVDVKSIAISSVTAMVFAPASMGANYVVNSAFSGVETAGATGFVAQFAANFAMGGNISILQSIIDLF